MITPFLHSYLEVPDMWNETLETLNPYEALGLEPEPKPPKQKRPGPFRLWLFEVRWLWVHRSWKPTRQKHKAFQRDYERFAQGGIKPW